MPYIKVSTTKIKNYSSEIDLCRSKLQNIKNQFGSICSSIDGDVTSVSSIDNKVSKINRELNVEIKSLNNMKTYCVNSAGTYSLLDGKVSDVPKDFASETVVATTISAAAPGAYWDWFGADTEDGKEAYAYIGKGHAGTDWDWGSAEIDAYLGKASAWWKFDFNFLEFENKKEEGEDAKETASMFGLDIEAGASAEVFSTEGNVTLGDGNLGFGIEGEGAVGKAEASVGFEFGVGEDGVDANFEAEAMVAAVEGEAKATFSLFGLDFTFKIGGYAGALGAEAKAGIDDNKFVAEAGLAALFGVSLGFEVGFNDAALQNIQDAWEATTDFVEDAWEATTDFVEDAWEATTDFVEDAWEGVTNFASDAWSFITSW